MLSISSQNNFAGITDITRFLLHNFQLKLLSIALYYFMSILYMYSNWNYQNLPWKICRIEKYQITISPYSIFEVDKLPNDDFFLNSYKCGHRNVLSKRQVWMSIFHIINFKKINSWTQGSWIFLIEN
jgi:hypothetical protein